MEPPTYQNYEYQKQLIEAYLEQAKQNNLDTQKYIDDMTAQMVAMDAIWNANAPNDLRG